MQHKIQWAVQNMLWLHWGVDIFINLALKEGFILFCLYWSLYPHLYGMMCKQLITVYQVSNLKYSYIINKDTIQVQYRKNKERMHQRKHETTSFLSFRTIRRGKRTLLVNQTTSLENKEFYAVLVLVHNRIK